jgi:hypothetical protein
MTDSAKETAFSRAASELGIPEEELKLWLLETKDLSPGQWSHWKHNRRPIPPEDLLEFMKARRAKGIQGEGLVSRARGALSDLEHLEDGLKKGIEDHLSRQVDLLTALGRKIDELARLVLEGGRAAARGDPGPPPDYRPRRGARTKAASGRRGGASAKPG